jgi:hypothetical protein
VTRAQKQKAHLAGCDVHDEVHGGEIAWVGETVLDELEDGKARRPYIGCDGVFLPHDAFGLSLARVSKSALWGNLEVTVRTAMYFVVPVNVPAREPMSSPETPKSQSLTTPCRERRTLEGLISRWMTFLECKYARPCRTCKSVPRIK